MKLITKDNYVIELIKIFFILLSCAYIHSFLKPQKFSLVFYIVLYVIFIFSKKIQSISLDGGKISIEYFRCFIKYEKVIVFNEITMKYENFSDLRTKNIKRLYIVSEKMSLSLDNRTGFSDEELEEFYNYWLALSNDKKV